MMGGPTEGTSLRELLRERRAEIQAAAARRGASNLRVFGSLARGDDADSDIDVLVDFEAPDRWSTSPACGWTTAASGTRCVTTFPGSGRDRAVSRPGPVMPKDRLPGWGSGG
jgi:hypothetical protein